MENEHPGRAEVDSQAVQRALQGDKSALTQIYDSYAKPIYCYQYSRVGNVTDAEDLTVQTFLAVIESLPRYQHRASNGFATSTHGRRWGRRRSAGRKGSICQRLWLSEFHVQNRFFSYYR
jgi:DNA-directed RNA polymerase specialized sigma24 family protein